MRGLEGPWLLFDDQQDPNQLDNLVDRPEFGALRSELDARLQTQLKAIGDDFQPAQHYIDAWGYEVAAHGSVSYAPVPKCNRPAASPPSSNLELTAAENNGGVRHLLECHASRAKRALLPLRETR